MKYFFDNCISYRYVDMLIALKVDGVALRSTYSASIKDVSLFEALRGSNVVYVSGDTSQTTRLQEARALKEAGITALFLGRYWSRKPFWQQAVWLVTKWPIIDGFACGAACGTCADIRENGRAMPFQL